MPKVKQEYMYVLVEVDVYSNWVAAITVREKSASIALIAFRNMISMFLKDPLEIQV